METEDWVVATTRDAMTRVLAHAEKVGLANTEEFTFRAFFMAAAADLLHKPRFQTEWHTFDLLVQVGGVNTLIEFKYYLLRRTHDLGGAPGLVKGGPGVQNEREFHACLTKLRHTVVSGIGERRLVLVYAHPEAGWKGRSWADSYGKLAQSTEIARVWPLTVGEMEARVLEPTPTG